MSDPATAGALSRRKSSFSIRINTHEHALLNPLLKPPAKCIFGLIVFRHCNEKHYDLTGDVEAWPSLARLAFESSMKPDTVSSAIIKLCATGYLECVRKGSRGRGLTSRYRVVPHPAPARPEKHPMGGGIKCEFLGAKIPSDRVFYEYDDGPENTQIGSAENTQIGRDKTPERPGATSPYEPIEENPSRATTTTAETHWAHELEGCDLMRRATLGRAG